MPENKANAILFETLVLLYKGDEKKAYSDYSSLLLTLDLKQPLGNYIYDISKVINISQADIFSAYNRVSHAFEQYNFKYTILTQNSPYFPKSLNTSEFPACFLYLVGDVSLLEKKKIGLWGMHMPSLQGKSDTIKLVDEVNEGGACLVTTFDQGLSTYSLLVAEKLDLKPIVVLQTPLHQCQPQTDKALVERIANNGGLLVSRFSPIRKTEKWYSVLRNRLLTELIDILMLVEEKDGGPGWNIAQIVKDSGKEVLLTNMFADNPIYQYAQRFSKLDNVIIYHRNGDLLRKLKDRKKTAAKQSDTYEQLSLF